MTVNTTIRSGDQALPAVASLIPMLLICCSLGTVGQVYSFAPGADVTGSLGGGTGADAVCAVLRGSKATVKATVCEGTWSGAPSVVHVGTGPTVTCALATDSPGAYDDHKFLLTITSGGAGGAGAAASVCFDGATVVDTLQIPAENPAVARGAVDITNGAVLTGYVANTLTALTLVYADPSATTLTFGVGSLAASAAGLRAAFASSVAVQTWTTADLLDPGEAVIALNPRKLIFTTAGATASDAPANCTITGTRYGAAVTEVLTLSQVAGAVSSVNTYDVITSIVFAAGDGAGATIALGYTSAFATGQEIVDAYNVLTIAAPLALRARLAETAAGQFLEVYSTAVGAAARIELDDATSTADTPLGFTSAADNLIAEGAAATWSPPWTGLTFTFPASAVYVVGDTYSATAVGPRASVASLVDGANAARASYRTNPFGFLVVAQPANDAPTCKATNSALATLTNSTWSPDPYRPIFVTSVTGSQFHTASSTRATNNTNITAADAALQLAFAGAAANLDSVAVDDVYLPGDTSLVLGSFRRTAALVWAVKNASKTKLAADVGDGVIPEATLLGPDGLTYARDASVQTTHLEDNNGFSVLRSTSQGEGVVKFCPGFTRAGPTSRLRFEGPVTVALTVATTAFAVVELWEGMTKLADPTTGMLSDATKKELGNELFSALVPIVLPDGGDPNASAFPMPEILNPLAGRTIDNGQVRVKIVFYVLAEILTVYIDISASGVVTSIAA